jgi:hypothetical protein
VTLNARQVRAAARRPARGGRAGRSAFRLWHGGARDGEHDRPDVEGTNDVEHQKPGAPLPTHDVPHQHTPVQ